MSTVELRADDRIWSLPDLDGMAHGAGRYRRAARALVALTAVGVGVIDMGLIVAAFIVAYWARFVVPDSAATSALGIEQYLQQGLLVAALSAVMFGTHGLFDLERPQRWSVRSGAVISAISTALVLAVGISYFAGNQAFSRLWFATGWGVAVVASVAWRTFAHGLYASVRDVLEPSKRALVVGANRLGQQLAEELRDSYRVVGFVDNGSDLDYRSDLPLLAPIAELAHVVQAYAVDEVIIALPASRTEQVMRIIDRGFHRRVRIKFPPTLCDLPSVPLDVHELGGRRYIGFAPVAAVSWAKRALDVLLVAAGLIAISPLLLIIALAIKLDSPGPLLYRQVRVGKDGRRFQMYKFRSMWVDAERHLETLRGRNEATGPLFKMKDDPRVTRVGRFIRRWSLDELPQLFNVLRSEMSLVGPRPPLPAEVARYEDWQFGRLRAVPGLTGLWQVSGRSDVPFHDMVRLDLHYIRNWSLGLDLEILLRTVPAVLSNRGAY